MPVEKSGQAAFEFEFGDGFGRHVEAFDPAYAKVLVRYNPAGDRELNVLQRTRLRLLSDWLHARGRRLLFELLVPPQETQLAGLGGDADRFDVELRPSLVVETIRELQDAGVEPHLWKIEGLDRREDCIRVVEQARADGRDEVACIVLGRGADEDRVVGWLRQAASVDGFAGFAVGRTLWWDELVGYTRGTLGRVEAAVRIGRNHRRMIDVFAAACA